MCIRDRKNNHHHQPDTCPERPSSSTTPICQTQATSHLPPHPPGLQPPPTTGREIRVLLPRAPLPPQAALHPSPPRISSSTLGKPRQPPLHPREPDPCLLYTSDAADDLTRV